MPTGYTSNIKDGITFKQFALGCARAFGAFIDMRDEPNDAPIPKELKFESYHQEQLIKAKKCLLEAVSMTLEQAQKELDEYVKRETERCLAKIKGDEELAISYNDMIEQAKSYIPPTLEHQAYKDFMIQQLESSLNFDCDSSYYQKELKELQEPMTASQWKIDRIEDSKREIEYHKKGFEADKKRFEDRNIWVIKLHESLKGYE